jgi:hypothetical protein
MIIAKKMRNCNKKKKKGVVFLTEQELMDMARQERNRHLREWRANNKDKVKEYNERYWIKKAEKSLAEREG